MDDLKVVLYVVIAIVWMIYNNYKKVGAADKKRNPAQPVVSQDEMTVPDQMEFEPRQKVKRQYVENTKRDNKEIQENGRDKMKRQPLKKASMLSKKRTEPLFLSTIEGGITQPSKIVQFEIDDLNEEIYDNRIEQIRNADFKQAIIMNEILQRPYI